MVLDVNRGLVGSLFIIHFLTPFVGKLAFKLGATDKPNERKVHSKIMPRMGGLAIFLSFALPSCSSCLSWMILGSSCPFWWERLSSY